MQKILVVAAHPDDEILGCGGTILEHLKQKDKVGIIIVSEGITSRNNSKKTKLINLNKLHQITKKISKNLKLDFLKIFNFPDNKLDQVEQLTIIKKIEKILEKFKPTTIYTHHSSDLNIDHRIVNNCVMVAGRPFPKQSVKKIFTFEIPSSTNWTENSKNSFSPNYFVEISKSLKKKINLLKMYKKEIRKWPHARSIKAVESLAYFRGSSIGVKSAEAFQVARYIKKN